MIVVWQCTYNQVQPIIDGERERGKELRKREARQPIESLELSNYLKVTYFKNVEKPILRVLPITFAPEF